MSFIHRRAFAALSVIFALFVVATLGPDAARAASDQMTAKYKFELVGSPQKAAGGKSIVRVKLVRLSDGKPVPKAVIFETRADMGPDGMATMTAPVKVLPESEPGIYPIEIEPGMAGGWALALAAKVQGEPETVRGTLTFKLEK